MHTCALFMATTIKDIARKTGFTHSTVSRALNGSSLISEETISIVTKAARDMGYHPSAAARSLKTNQTRALGVVVRNIDDPFFSEVLQGVEDIARERGYSIFISSSMNDPNREQSIVESMREHRVDGIIICSTSFSASQSRHLQDYDVPIVVVNNQASEDYRFAISHDDVDGSRQITRHLIELGHQHIAYLGNSISGRTNLERLSGFQQEMAAHGITVLPENLILVPGGEPAMGSLGAEKFISLTNQPSGLVCFNDMMAIGVLRKFEEAGIRIPEDCSVTGFDNISFSEFSNPPLTTFDQPKHFIGAEAAGLALELLQQKHEGNGHDPVNRLLKGNLLVRQSTTSPQKSGSIEK